MLFKKAYDDGHDYFVQSGDDILYHTKDWLNLCIYHFDNYDCVYMYRSKNACACVIRLNSTFIRRRQRPLVLLK